MTLDAANDDENSQDSDITGKESSGSYDSHTFLQMNDPSFK